MLYKFASNNHARCNTAGYFCMKKSCWKALFIKNSRLMALQLVVIFAITHLAVDNTAQQLGLSTDSPSCRQSLWLAHSEYISLNQVIFPSFHRENISLCFCPFCPFCPFALLPFCPIALFALFALVPFCTFGPFALALLSFTFWELFLLSIVSLQFYHLNFHFWAFVLSENHSVVKDLSFCGGVDFGRGVHDRFIEWLTV